MKAKPALLLLAGMFLFLSACRSHSAPVSRAPSAGPEAQPSGSHSREPAEESLPPALSLEDYRAMVSAFHGRIMDESLILIQAGLYEYNWWGSYSGESDEVDLDAMVDQVMAWLGENFDSDAHSIAAARDDLLSRYAAIACARVEGGAPPELSGPVDALFSAYYQLHAIVTEPSGTVPDFVRMLCSCTYSITTAGAELGSALEPGLSAFPQPEGSPPSFVSASYPYGRQKGGAVQAPPSAML